MTDNKPKFVTLRFSGSKLELHDWLKEQCAKADEDVSPTVIALIERYQDELSH
jgi:hypothetical protein